MSVEKIYDLISYLNGAKKEPAMEISWSLRWSILPFISIAFYDIIKLQKNLRAWIKKY